MLAIKKLYRAHFNSPKNKNYLKFSVRFKGGNLDDLLTHSSDRIATSFQHA